jgi:hypothetical protein
MIYGLERVGNKWTRERRRRRRDGERRKRWVCMGAAASYSNAYNIHVCNSNNCIDQGILHVRL